MRQRRPGRDPRPCQSRSQTRSRCHRDPAKSRRDRHRSRCSITGIGVYRGETSPDLDGIYFASDFCSGKVWGLAQDDAGAWQFEELLDTELLVTGAGQSEDGELYVTACECQFGRGYDPFENPTGTVWQLVSSDQVPEGATTAAVAGTPAAATPEN